MKLRIPAISVLFGAFGCTQGPMPCNSPGTCGSGYECLANRCAPLGSELASPTARRIVLTPANIAVVTASGQRPTLGVPGAVRFGSAQEGAAALYLRFGPLRATAPRIEHAFVLLQPLPGAPRSGDDVRVEALRVGEGWNERTLSWSNQPRVGLPASPALARAAPPSTLRIDVTELVRYQRQRSQADVAVAIKAGSGSGAGAAFATGATQGHAPRLEVYVR